MKEHLSRMETPPASLPLSSDEYRTLRARIQCCYNNIADDRILANMTGYLNALQECLQPVIQLSCYPVPRLLDAIKRMRTYDATRKEILTMCQDLMSAIDGEITQEERMQEESMGAELLNYLHEHKEKIPDMIAYIIKECLM